MSKLMHILAAGVFALSLGGGALAADQKPQDQSPNPSPQGQTTAPADQSKQEQEYLAALKKCQSQQGDAKQKCVDEAKQKFDRM